MSIYKTIGLFGNSGVGKSAFMKRHLSGEFLKDHVVSDRIVHPILEFSTNQGKWVFTVIENPIESDMESLDGVILLESKIGEYGQINCSVPFVSALTKMDTLAKDEDTPENGIASKSNYRISTPFKRLMEHYKKSSIEFLPKPLLKA